jgi:hypothetical protein
MTDFGSTIGSVFNIIFWGKFEMSDISFSKPYVIKLKALLKTFAVLFKMYNGKPL